MVSVIATQGCVHGDLDRCYEAVKTHAEESGDEIKLVVWSGDVQSARNAEDLESLACPPKYRQLKDFHGYYDGIKSAPFLTIFTGGNHEASSFVDRLYFGGWVAPNIFYMGRSLVLWIDEWRLAGLSGIFKGYDYRRGYFELPPYDEGSIRSVYHFREYEMNKLRAVSEPIDMVLSHEWPSNVIQNQRDKSSLIRKKPFFKDEVNRGALGNEPSQRLLEQMQPRLWVAAHLHVNFRCEFTNPKTKVTTRFLAHDKPKGRVSTSYIDMKTGDINYLGNKEGTEEGDKKRARVEENGGETTPTMPEIDLEWLVILKRAHGSAPIGEERQDQTFCRCARHTDPDCLEMCRPSWGVVVDMADNVDRVMSTTWKNELEALKGDTPDITLVPEEVQLRKWRFRLPDWTVLKPEAPQDQTRWWLRLLGEDDDTSIEWRIREKMTVASGNPLLE